jgi:hypothetical protein
MRTIRLILVLTIAFLCLSVVVRLGFSIYEEVTWPAPDPRFAVDAPRQYTVGLFHILSFLVLGFSLSRKYLAAFLVSLVYFFLNLYSTRERACNGFLGSDFCPDTIITNRAITRISYFDWTTNVLIILIICFSAVVLLFQFRRRRQT